jgi:hypothetical protein
VFWYPVSEKVSPFEPSAFHGRERNWTWSFEFVAMPSSRIARSFRSENPAAETSTERRRIENGSARTTVSAVTVVVFDPIRKLSE